MFICYREVDPSVSAWFARIYPNIIRSFENDGHGILWPCHMQTKVWDQQNNSLHSLGPVMENFGSQSTHLWKDEIKVEDL